MTAETVLSEFQVTDRVLLEVKRASIMHDLVNHGLVSQEFADNGILSEYGLFEQKAAAL